MTPPTEPQSPEEETLEAILGLVEAGRVRLYCKPAGGPYLQFSEDPPERFWPLSSDRIRAWIAYLCFQSSGQVLTARAVNRIIRILEGEAWESGRRDGIDLHLIEFVENEPVVEAVLQFMDQKGTEYQQFAEKLYEQVTKVARNCKLTVGGDRKWPGASWVFSGRLRKSAWVLEALGITVMFDRTNEGCRITLRKVTSGIPGDASTVTASLGASRENLSQSNDLGDENACDGKSTVYAQLDRLRQDEQLHYPKKGRGN